MSGTLPSWVERLLGVDAATSGEGTTWSLGGSWGWAPWVTLLFVVFAVAFVAVVYHREGGEAGRLMKIVMASMRLALIAIAALMIAELVLSLERTGLPHIAILLDESASMQIEDRYDEPALRQQLADRLRRADLDESLTRMNVAKSLLLENDAALLRGIAKDYKLRVYRVAGAAQPTTGELDSLVSQIRELEPTGQSSRLGDCVRAVFNDLRGTTPAAIILLSDGITTEGESLAEVASYARRKGVPLFTVGIGSDEEVRDLDLHDLLVDEVVFVDDIVNFEFKLTGTGLEGRRVEVVLREQGKPEALATLPVTVGPDGQPQHLRLPYRPTRVGEFEFVLELEPLPEEASDENNQQIRPVSVRKEQIRTLLVQAYPNWEFRNLKNLLERDNTIELRTVLQEADPEYAEIDKSALLTFPVRREELFEYDVVIFGDVNPAFLSASMMQNLAEFVTTKGGGLVVIAGVRYTPLAYRDTPMADLMPVDFGRAGSPSSAMGVAEDFLIRPTELGSASPHMQLGDTLQESEEIWRDLPSVRWFFEVPGLRPAVRVLAEHPTRLGPDGRGLPIFSIHYVGAGKVLFHATDETWRWRFRVGDVFFARYWVQTIRYLSRAKLLGKDRAAELTSDRRQYRRGESARLRVRFIDERLAPVADDGVTVMVEYENEKKQKLKLRRSAGTRGLFEGVASGLVEGSYHAWITSPAFEDRPPSADFLVTAPPGEFERTEMDSAELERVSELTKGRFYRVSTAGRLLKDLPKGRQVPIEALPPVILWNRWPLLVLFLGLLIGEWLLRKRKGLL